MTTDTSRLSPAFTRILVLLFVSVFINYIDRSNLSIAAPLIKDELGISASQLGILLSAFFWTYSSCQLLSGWLVDHYDVKWVFAAGFLVWSSATALTSKVHTLLALLLVRIALGKGCVPRVFKDFGNALPRETSRPCQFHSSRRTGTQSQLWAAVRRNPGRALWMASLLPGVRPRVITLAAALA